MFGDAFPRTSALNVGLGVGGVVISPGFRACPSRSCDGWVCGLGEVVDSLVFTLVRGNGAFTVVLLTFVLVSRMQFAQQYRDDVHFLSTASSS